MSKPENFTDFYTDTSPVWPEKFSGICDVFKVWSQAFDRAREKSDTTKAQARNTMEKLWDTARDFPCRSAADMAALYIMAQNTITIDADSYLEDAWRIVTAASGEADLVKLYATWTELRQALDTLNLGDEAGDGIGRVLDGLEAQMAAIPATTAKGLAIKVDMFRNFNKGTEGLLSLDRDLAALTSVDKRPD